jgi:gliding motility-associated-like protein
MRHFFLLILTVVSLHSLGQIVTPSSAKVCIGQSLTFKVTVNTSDTITYQWVKNGTPIPDSTRQYLAFSSVQLSDSGYYSCIVTDTTIANTSDTAHLMVYLPLQIDTLYRSNSLFCPGVCKAIMVTQISGGQAPYIYNWGGGKPWDETLPSTQIDLCPGVHKLVVKDSIDKHCVARNYTVEAFKLPKVKMTKVPKDTVYLTNPTLTVSYPDSMKQYLTYWKWTFYNDTVVPHKDTASVELINPATHDYTRTGLFPIMLEIQDYNQCDSIVIDTILVKQVDLKIPSVFTPDGDAFNQTLEFQDNSFPSSTLDLQEVYPSSELYIFDRWGKKVYHVNNYVNNSWDGGNLSDGVYFYIFKGHGKYETDIFRGSVTILRKPK